MAVSTHDDGDWNCKDLRDARADGMGLYGKVKRALGCHTMATHLIVLSRTNVLGQVVLMLYRDKCYWIFTCVHITVIALTPPF